MTPSRQNVATSSSLIGRSGCLGGVVPLDILCLYNGIARGVTRIIAGRLAGAGGHVRAGTDHWTVMPAFREFAVASPLGAIAARLLRSETVRLYEDSVLVKEPGTPERTAFHQDLAYFHLDGTQLCTTWVPLDPVTADSGAVEFVAGSHRRPNRYRPNFFVTTMSMPDTDGEEVPEDAGVRDDERTISFDTEPGDITVHHARTIHGAHPNRSAQQRRRAISVRYAGDVDAHVHGLCVLNRSGGLYTGHMAFKKGQERISSIDRNGFWTFLLTMPAQLDSMLHVTDVARCPADMKDRTVPFPYKPLAFDLVDMAHYGPERFRLP